MTRHFRIALGLTMGFIVAVVACLGLALALTVLVNIKAAHSQTAISGYPRVIDGDTLDFDGVVVRLHGIDALENNQLCVNKDRELWECGARAYLVMRAKIARAKLAKEPVTCEISSKDRYRRFIAKCTTGGVDLGRWLVGIGMAIAYRRYSTDYVDTEHNARVNNEGIWAGWFLTPEQWRKEQGRKS